METSLSVFMDISRSFISTLTKEATMKFADPPKRITSSHFRQRAKHYRLAAAIADARRDVAMFRDLAMIFERLAEHFARAEATPRV
jgi:hypothetical protein